MKVILLQNIEKLGRRLEIKEVKRGHAQNFLIPKKLAKPANKEAMRWLTSQKEVENKKQEKELKKIQFIIDELNNLELHFPVKVGDKGQLFESINNQKIKESLQEKGIDIKKEQIYLQEPLKELGEFSVKIKFESNLEGIIKVIIFKEK